MGENLAEILRFPKGKDGIVNFCEGEVMGKIPADRLIQFHEVIDASAVESRFFARYDRLIIRGIYDAEIDIVQDFINRFPACKLYGEIELGREGYIVA